MPSKECPANKREVKGNPSCHCHKGTNPWVQRYHQRETASALSKM